MFVHYPLFTQNHPPFLYYKKGHIGILLANYGLNCYETQLLTDQELSSSTFPRCMFVCPSGPVTSPLLDHTNHTFLESLWLTHHPTQTHQAHHMAFWVSHSLLCLSFIIYLCSPNQILFSNFANNYFVWSWTFNPLKCKPPFFSSICVISPLTPDIIYFYFISGQLKEKLIILMFQKIFSKWHYDCSLNRNKNYNIFPITFPNFGHTFRFPTSGRPSEQQLCL